MEGWVHLIFLLGTGRHDKVDVLFSEKQRRIRTLKDNLWLKTEQRAPSNANSSKYAWLNDIQGAAD